MSSTVHVSVQDIGPSAEQGPGDTQGNAYEGLQTASHCSQTLWGIPRVFQYNREYAVCDPAV